MPTFSLRAQNRATLARQLLLERSPLAPLAAIEQLAGLQAQVPRPPFVGLWSRLKSFDRKELVTLLATKKVIRATLLRGTLHLFSAKDFLAHRGALQPMLAKGAASVLGDRGEGIDLPRLLAKARALLEVGPATFDDLRDRLVEAFPSWNDRAMGYLTRCHLPLVQVPEEGEPWAFPQAARFGLADAWLGKRCAPEAPPDALVLRYLAAFGPATPADAQAWSGLQGLREVFERLRPKLVTFRDEGKRELFDLPDAPRPDEGTLAPVRFVPDFDNLVLAHQDRRRVLADAHRGSVVTKNLLVRATVLVDGWVAGIWKVERKKAAATVMIESFAKITKKDRAALEEEGERLLGFVEPDAAKRAVQLR